MYLINIAVTVWWLLFFTAVALCIGSFLNVVIHRLPLGIELSDPRWSFCPSCENRIRWIDNLPVIGFLRLRGRCWYCWRPISPRYAVIEIVAAITVILLFDALFIAQARDGLSHVNDLTWRLTEDWPVFLGHVVLFTALLAMSVIDMQFYWVDIRFTHFASAAGIILAALWTPAHSRAWTRPLDGTLVATVPAFVVYMVVWLIIQRRRRGARAPDASAMASVAAPPAEQPDDTRTPSDAPPTAEPEPSDEHASSIRSVIPAIAVLVGLLVSVALAGIDVEAVSFTTRAGVCVAFLFLLLLYGASRRRDADEEIMHAIESEAPDARRMTLIELATLLPAIAAGVGAVMYVLDDPSAQSAIRSALHWRPARTAWQPLWGLACGVNGYVIAAAAGWTVRILANLLFGKEAFATGDIHMLAAAGAVVGWPVALTGFMLSCFAAVAGWLILLPFKRSRAIPLGPWLWIGFLAATLFFKPLAATRVAAGLGTFAEILVLDRTDSPLFDAAR